MGRPQPSAELKDLTHSFESAVLEQENMESMQAVCFEDQDWIPFLFPSFYKMPSDFVF